MNLNNYDFILFIDDQYLTSSETIEFTFPYESSYALRYKQALYESLRYDMDDYISNKYFCRELWEPVPDNCYSEYLPLQKVRVVVCPYYVTYKCNQCNQCLPNPCQNGGTCTTSNTNNPVCNCAFGWTGDKCQHAFQYLLRLIYQQFWPSAPPIASVRRFVFASRSPQTAANTFMRRANTQYRQLDSKLMCLSSDLTLSAPRQAVALFWPTMPIRSHAPIEL